MGAGHPALSPARALFKGSSARRRRHLPAAAKKQAGVASRHDARRDAQELRDRRVVNLTIPAAHYGISMPRHGRQHATLKSHSSSGQGRQGPQEEADRRGPTSARADTFLGGATSGPRHHRKRQARQDHVGHDPRHDRGRSTGIPSGFFFQPGAGPVSTSDPIRHRPHQLLGTVARARVHAWRENPAWLAPRRPVTGRVQARRRPRSRHQSSSPALSSPSAPAGTCEPRHHNIELTARRFGLRARSQLLRGDIVTHRYHRRQDQVQPWDHPRQDHQDQADGTDPEPTTAPPPRDMSSRSRRKPAPAASTSRSTRWTS